MPWPRAVTSSSSARSTGIDGSGPSQPLDPMAVAHRYSLSEAQENLGRVANLLGQKQQAVALLNDALKIYDELQSRGAISAEYAGVPARIRKELSEVK